jgi:trans-2,3-dihydro-3-hydroxyanthranilate isomerase
MPHQTRTLPFVQFDVFTSRTFEGNSLAIFPNANGLTTEQMQAIAKEMNLSETTFIERREPAIEKDRGVKVRIFTVSEELPFAGHPTLGTAFQLRGNSRAPQVVLDLKAGRVPVQFEDRQGEEAFGEMTQLDPQFGDPHDREAVVRAANLRDGDIDPSLPIQTVSTGVPFTIVPLRGLETARNLNIDLRSSAQYLDRSGGKFFYFVTREVEQKDARLHARMIFYNGEDPATGSAAGCAAAWMVAHKIVEPDQRALIEQGLEMGRPSRIFVRASLKDDRVVNVRVGGNAVEVLRGEILLPSDH